MISSRVKINRSVPEVSVTSGGAPAREIVMDTSGAFFMKLTSQVQALAIHLQASFS
jgi:hypothetical protein